MFVFSAGLLVPACATAVDDSERTGDRRDRYTLSDASKPGDDWDKGDSSKTDSASGPGPTDATSDAADAGDGEDAPDAEDASDAGDAGDDASDADASDADASDADASDAEAGDATTPDGGDDASTGGPTDGGADSGPTDAGPDSGPDSGTPDTCVDELICAICTPVVHDPVFWDDANWRCIDKQGRVTDRRNPYPGRCGTVVSDNERVMQGLKHANKAPGKPWVPKDVDDHLDLSNLDLMGARFHGRFTMTNFRGADLRAADFRDAEVVRGDFRGVDARRADFREVELVGSSFAPGPPGTRSFNAQNRSVLWQANFRNAKIDLARFDGALAIGTDFAGARGESVVFDGAWAYGAGSSFWGVRFPNASFVGTDFGEKANFAQSNLTLADFRGARFGAIDVAGANLNQANLCGAPFLREIALTARVTSGILTDLPDTNEFRELRELVKLKGYIFVPADRCASHAPRAVAKMDLRDPQLVDIVDGAENMKTLDTWRQMRSNEAFEYSSHLEPPVNSGDLIGPSQAERLLKAGLLVNIGRGVAGDVYLLRLGDSYIVYTRSNREVIEDGNTPWGAGAAGRPWWKSTLSPKGKAPILMNPHALADLYFYDEQDISHLHAAEVTLLVAYAGVQIIPGSSLIAIPMENMLLGKEIWTWHNGARVALDVASVFTLGSSKVAQLGPQATQVFRLVAVGAAVSGSVIYMKTAGEHFQKEEYVRGVLDVGGSVIGLLLAGKNLKDFYQVRELIRKARVTNEGMPGPLPLQNASATALPASVPDKFTRSPLKADLDPNKEAAAQGFVAWMEGLNQNTVAAMENVAPIIKSELIFERLRRARIAKQRELDPNDVSFGAPNSGNRDPWGKWISGSHHPEEAAARAQVGKMGRDRLEREGTPIVDDIKDLVNKYETRAGDLVDGVNLSNNRTYHPALDAMDRSSRVATVTAQGLAQQKILADVWKRLDDLVAAKVAGTLKVEEGSKQLATAIYGYYQALPVQRGGDAIGRVMFSSYFNYLFNGKKMPMPELLDGYAYVQKQCVFVNWLGKHFKEAAK